MSVLNLPQLIDNNSSLDTNAVAVLKKRKANRSGKKLPAIKHRKLKPVIPNIEATFNEQQQTRINAHEHLIKFNPIPNTTNSYKIINRLVGTTEPEPAYIQPHYYNEKILNNVRPNISGEGIVFFLHLEGCSKNLMLFIMQYKVMMSDYCFLFNQQVRDEFQDFCKLTGIAHADGSVTQALKILRKKNVIINFVNRKYMVNPLLLIDTDLKRKSFNINKYCRYLLENGKDPVVDFYPPLT